MTLIERIESADGPDRNLFAEAHLALNPEPVGEQAPIQTDNWRAWSNGRYKFGQLLAAGAFLDAALTLVPDSDDRTAVFWQIGNDGAGGNPADFLARVLVCTDLTSREYKAVSATPALAVSAAALKAGGYDADL